MEMREFTRHDWDAFCGAEAWRTPAGEGSLPLITSGTLEDGKEYVLVLDRTGGCLMIEDEEQSDYGGWQLLMPFPTQRAAIAFGKGLGEPKHKLDFFCAGFETI